MDKHDRAALKLALALGRNEDTGRAQQIDAKLEDEPWDEVAAFAARAARPAHCGSTRGNSRPATWMKMTMPTPSTPMPWRCCARCWPLECRAMSLTRWRRSKRGRRFDDDDVADCCGLARLGLMQSADTAA